jgi:hypothetical protein
MEREKSQYAEQKFSSFHGVNESESRIDEFMGNFQYLL